MNRNRNRNSHVESSYTGVGAFSSAPAPHTNALAAASVIGAALKNNNHNPSGLQYPKIQPPKATLAQRAGSITSMSPSNNRSNSVRVNSINSSSIARANTVDTANARRLSLSSVPKQRLSYQKSAPALHGRRSISDLGDANSAYKPIVHLPVKNVPKTIKRYVPSANGLVAIEVPNPEHPDNMTPTQKQAVMRSNSYRRSVSLANLSSSRANNRNSSLTQRNPNSYSKPTVGKEPTRSITKNIKRETRFLPDGTKVISTTVEEYYNTGSDAEFEDSYENFDGEIENKQVDMSVTLDERDFDDEAEVVVAHDYSTHDILNEIHEEDEEDGEIQDKVILGELEDEINYENEVKEAIKKNEELESHDREKAFVSEEQPINDTVIIEDLLTRKFAHDPDSTTYKIGLTDIVSHGLSKSNSPESLTPAIETPPVLKKLDFATNTENSYDDFYETGFERKNPIVDSYADDLQEGDYTNEIDEDVDDIKQTYSTEKSTEQEYSEEEYIAAQKKLDELVKAKEQEILESIKLAEIAKENQETNLETETNIALSESNQPQFNNINPVSIAQIDDFDDTYDDLVPSTPKKVVQVEPATDITYTPVSEANDIFNNSQRNDTTPVPTNTATTSSSNPSPIKKSMAQHLRPTVAMRTPTQQTPNTPSKSLDVETPEPIIVDSVDMGDEPISVSQLEVPMREPIVQAIIDERSRSNSLKIRAIEEPLDAELKSTQLQPTASTSSLTKRKSVLKNSTPSRQSLYMNQSKEASDVYLSLATAQNTKLNSKSNAPSIASRRQSVGALQDPNMGTYTRSRSGSAASSTVNLNNNEISTPLAAAARAAQRHSAQPGTLNKQFDQSVQNKRSSVSVMGNRELRNVDYDQVASNFGGQKAPNPKVEDAKKRILGNRPSTQRAKDLYEKSKLRPQMKAEDLIAINNKSTTLQRKSSFEKISDVVTPVFGTNPESNPAFGRPKDKTSMVSLSLRDQGDLNYDNYSTNKHSNRTFKSRFADDGSDTDIPFPTMEPIHVNKRITMDSPINSGTPVVAEKQRSTSGFKLFKKKNKPASEHKESRLEKFFTEPHGPSSDQRNFSQASAYTENSYTNTEGKKKKGFFKKMFQN